GDIVVAATSGYINLAAGAVLMNWSGAVSPSGYTLYVNGGAYKTVGGADWNTLSDKRFKKDIRDYEDGLDLIKKIEPKRFRYNGKLNTNPDNLEIGVIAQDLQV